MGRWQPGKFPPGPPPNYNPEDPYADPVALLEYREWQMREKLVKVEEAKIIREQLKKCYKEEGVNSWQSCKPLAERYMESIRNVGIHRQNAGATDVRTPSTL